MSDTHLPTLPNKAIEVILSKLPIKSLLRFTIVSKSWKAIICSPRFNIQRCNSQPQDLYFAWGFEQYSTLFYCLKLDLEKRNLIAHESYQTRASMPLSSSNGIVLMKSIVGEVIHLSLFNPTIAVNATILSQHVSRAMSINHGHYYDSRIDDYRVVVVSRRRSGDITCSVFSCRNRRWEDEKPFPYYAESDLVMERAVFVDGCFYWWVVREKLLMCFDVREGSLRVMPVPEEVRKVGKGCKIKLTEVAGRLCLYSKSKDWMDIRVWVMEKDADGWKELFRMLNNEYVSGEKSCLINQDLVVCLTDGSESLQSARFVVYNEDEGRYEIGQFGFDIDYLTHYFFLPFRQSLFSPMQHW